MLPDLSTTQEHPAFRQGFLRDDETARESFLEEVNAFLKEEEK